MTRVAVLISGGGSNMVALVRAMQDGGFAEPVLVLSNLPDAGGLARAAALGVPTAVVDHRGRPRPAFEADLRAALHAARPDWVCLAGFMRILSAETIAPFAGRMLNIHPSLLPLYPGLHTHERAIAAGDTWAGATVHQVIPALDAGPILGQARVPVMPGDTAQTLAARVLPMEHRLYPAVLARAVRGETGVLTL